MLKTSIFSLFLQDRRKKIKFSVMCYLSSACMVSICTMITFCRLVKGWPHNKCSHTDEWNKIQMLWKKRRYWFPSLLFFSHIVFKSFLLQIRLTSGFCVRRVIYFWCLATFFMFTECSCRRCPVLWGELYKFRISFLSISAVYSKYFCIYCFKLILYTAE